MRHRSQRAASPWRGDRIAFFGRFSASLRSIGNRLSDKLHSCRASRLFIAACVYRRRNAPRPVRNLPSGDRGEASRRPAWPGPSTSLGRSNRSAIITSPPDTWYAITKRDGAYYQRRWRVGFSGKETEVQESRIDYVMGSGNHVRTYLHRTDRGVLIELPLAWYSEDGGKWAMNPGHDRDYALPPRAVAYECMFCHNAYPKIPAGHDQPGSEPLFEGLLPEGIGCERCHGDRVKATCASRGRRAPRWRISARRS